MSGGVALFSWLKETNASCYETAPNSVYQIRKGVAKPLAKLSLDTSPSSANVALLLSKCGIPVMKLGPNLKFI